MHGPQPASYGLGEQRMMRDSAGVGVSTRSVIPENLTLPPSELWGKFAKATVLEKLEKFTVKPENSEPKYKFEDIKLFNLVHYIKESRAVVVRKLHFKYGWSATDERVGGITDSSGCPELKLLILCHINSNTLDFITDHEMHTITKVEEVEDSELFTCESSLVRDLMRSKLKNDWRDVIKERILNKQYEGDPKKFVEELIRVFNVDDNDRTRAKEAAELALQLKPDYLEALELFTKFVSFIKNIY